jgi:hypothetical protein
LDSISFLFSVLSLSLSQAIAKELARKLGMGTNIIALPRAHGGTDKDANVNKTRLKDEVEGADGFSQVWKRREEREEKR